MIADDTTGIENAFFQNVSAVTTAPTRAYFLNINVNVKVKFTLEQAMKD